MSDILGRIMVASFACGWRRRYEPRAALSSRRPLPLSIGQLPEGRFPPSVETAAYTVVAEAARSATGGLSVHGDCSGGMLVIEVGIRGDASLNIVGLADRLGALDGQLDVGPGADGGITIRPELPCAS